MPQDILTDQELIADPVFFEKVQNPGTRLADTRELVRISLLALAQSSSVTVRSGAVCVLAYRLLDDMADDRLSFELICAQGDQVLAQLEEYDGPDWMRWVTSVNMAVGYVKLKSGEERAALKHFEYVMENRSKLHLWPTMTPSHVAAALFSGCIHVKLGNPDDGRLRFEIGAKVFREGVNCLDLSKYWASFELVSATMYLIECNNELAFVRDRKIFQERGEKLFGPVKKLFTSAFTAHDISSLSK